MSIFNDQRLTNATLKLDTEGIRQGWYSDKYFENISRMLTSLNQTGYTFQAESPRLPRQLSQGAAIGDMQVEAQWFTRRQPFVLIGGLDVALIMLRHCTGYFDDSGEFINIWHQLEVEAIQDGMLVPYSGDPLEVLPILKVRGIYRHFALLETTTLGYLTRISRIATNVYLCLIAARGKKSCFFQPVSICPAFRPPMVMPIIWQFSAITWIIMPACRVLSAPMPRRPGGMAVVAAQFPTPSSPVFWQIPPKPCCVFVLLNLCMCHASPWSILKMIALGLRSLSRRPCSSVIAI